MIKKHSFFIRILMLILLVFVTMSCYHRKQAGPVEDGVWVRNRALDFIEMDSAGNPLQLRSLQGKVVMMEFFALYCTACKERAPELMELYSRYKERGLEIVQIINYDAAAQPVTQPDLLNYVNQYHVGFRVVGDPDSSTCTAYELYATPLILILDRDQIIRYRTEGYAAEEITDAIESCL